MKRDLDIADHYARGDDTEPDPRDGEAAKAQERNRLERGLNAFQSPIERLATGFCELLPCVDTNSSRGHSHRARRKVGRLRSGGHEHEILRRHRDRSHPAAPFIVEFDRRSFRCGTARKRCPARRHR